LWETEAKKIKILQDTKGMVEIKKWAKLLEPKEKE
jgi:hypothetical protein